MKFAVWTTYTRYRLIPLLEQAGYNAAFIFHLL